MKRKIFKKLMSLFLTLAMVLSLMPALTISASAAGTWDGTTEAFTVGDGSSGSPYEIATSAQLAYMADKVNNDNSNYGSKYYKLTADIDLNSQQWTPIGNTDVETGTVFAGNFDGNGYTVSNLAIGTALSRNTTLLNAGLFGFVKGGTIANLGIKDALIFSADSIARVGGLAGIVESGSVSNCYVTGCISGGGSEGGLIGELKNSGVSNSFSAGSVIGGAESCSGGLIGFAQASTDSNVISNCYSTCSVAGTYPGGFIGWISGKAIEITVSNCYSTGNVTGTETNYCGGFIGYRYESTEGTLTNCYFSSSATQLEKGVPQAAGVGTGTDDTIAKTSVYMLSTDFVDDLNAGGTTWASGASADNQGYPILSSNAVSSTLNKITYDGNGNTDGVIPMDTGAYPSGTSVTLAGNTGSLEKTGYVFNGWSTSAAGTESAGAECATYTVTSSQTLYAKWILESNVPTVTDANIAIGGATGTGGAYKIGDTITATWNNTSSGDNNSSTISAVKVDFSAFGGGTKVTANNSSGIWTATYTIPAGSIVGTNKNVSVTATNSGGSKTTAGTTNATVDNQAPTVSISYAASSPTKDSPIAVTITFSESVTGFMNSGVTLTNGTLDTLMGSDSTYILSIIPSSQGAVKVDVPAGVAHDAVGNNNTAATQYSITYDTIAPTVTISSVTAATTSTSPIPITVTFSEAVTGFAASDITVSNGTLGTLSESGAVYNINLTPSGSGIVTVNIASGAAQDAAGNNNTAATQLSRNFVNVAPTVTTMIVSTYTAITAIMGGDVTADNGATVTERGVVYSSTITTPTIGESYVTQDANGTGTGIFSETIYGLTANTTYYVRAYAINSGGTSYGTIESFTTSVAAPTTTVAAIAFSADTGSSNTDFITGVAAQTISAVLSSALGGSDKVYGSLDDGATWTDITSKVSGTSISWNGVTLTGSNTLKFKVVDADENDGAVSSQAYVLDTTAPTVTGVTSTTANGGYKAGDVIAITVSFSKVVNVTGTPQLTIETGTTDSAVNYASGSGTSTLTFNYTIQPGDTSPDLDYTATNALSLNGGTIKDAAGNNAVLTLATPGAANSLGTNKALVIDGVLPTVTGVSSMTANGSYKAGDVIAITVPFSEAVTVTGTPQLMLETGTTDSAVNYASGSGTSTLTFNYTIQPGDTSPDLDYTATNALSLNGGTIKDAAGNNAVLTLETPGAANSLGANKALVIDGVALTVNISSGASNPTKNSPITVTITFSKSVSDFELSDITVTNGAVSNLSGSGTTYTADITPSGQGAVKVDVAAGVAHDAASNANTAATQLSRIYDSAAPTVSSIDRYTPPAGTTNATGVVYRVTFSEAVTGVDTGDFVLTTTDSAVGTILAVSSSSGIMIDVSVSSVSGMGTLRLDLKNSGTNITDIGGNAISAGFTSGQTFSIDSVSPTVSSVSVPASGKYMAGAELVFSVNFDEGITVNTTGGTPRIALTIGAATIYANYTSTGSTSTVLKFAYTILPGQTDTDGIAVGALSLNGGSIIDAAGNDATLTLNSVGSTVNVLVDTTAPTAGNSGTIAVSDLTSNSAKLTWTAATDSGTAPVNLQYKVVYSTSNITSVAAADTLSGTWTSNITTAAVAGLAASTDYYFNVLVKDEAGNKTLYTVATGKTTAAATGGGGSGGGGSNSGSTSGSTVVEVNGQKQDAGNSATTTTGGQTTTTIKVDDTKLNQILESSGENPKVTFPTSGKSDVVVGELNGQTVKNMETKSATLEIKTETVSYTLPASQINIDAVSSQLGSKVELKDIKVSVKIAEPSADTVKIVENTADKNNYQIVVKPIEFEITCTSGNKTVDVSKFNGYVERTVAIPDGVDPSKITTGIVLNSDGTFSHVPTQIVVINGKHYAKINSLTNSTYSVIWNPVTFTDVANHWSKNTVNDMGSRMVVTGTGNGTYEPDRSITRAEFAAIAVRAMGLQKGTTESNFGDVTLTDWFNGYVDTATGYSLITGYDSTSYGPSDMITREQAMAILARAMKLTGLNTSLTDSEKSTILSKYTDGALISDYAETSAAICIKTGVVTGSSKTTLSPKAYVTRAEVAAMVQRLLQKSGLI